MGGYLNYLLIGGFTDKKKKLSKDSANFLMKKPVSRQVNPWVLLSHFGTSGYFFLFVAELTMD